MTPSAVYRHYDAEARLLYVGVTNNPERRLAEHKCRAAWAGEIASINVKWFDNREDAEAAERKAIELERPIFNGGCTSYTPTGDCLRDWMAGNGVTQVDLAKEFGVTQAQFSRILNRQNMASLEFAVFIEDRTEGAVPVRYWLTSSQAEAAA